MTLIAQDANRVEGRGILTAREQQVIALVCQGLSNKEVARELGLSEGTVKLHVHSIIVKTGFRSRREMIVAGSRMPKPL